MHSLGAGDRCNWVKVVRPVWPGAGAAVRRPVNPDLPKPPKHGGRPAGGKGARCTALGGAKLSTWTTDIFNTDVYFIDNKYRYFLTYYSDFKQINPLKVD